MAIKLYGYWRSSAAYRVRIALQLKGLEFENIPVSLVPGVSEHRESSYRDKNPQMLVPFLEDGDVRIGQSMAMLEYLDEAYPATRLIPTDEPLRSQVRAFANVIACDVHPLQNLRVLQYVGNELNGDSNAWAAHWMIAGFDALEALIGPGPFAFGEHATIADALLVPQIYNAKRRSISLDQYPKVVAAAQHCDTLDAFKQAAPEAQPDAN